MNRIYKVIWSKVKNCYIVVSEIAKSHSKPISTKLNSGKTVAAVLAVAALCAGMTTSVMAADQYYSVNDYGGYLSQMGNKNNDGAQGIGSLAAGAGATVQSKSTFQGAMATVVGSLNTVATESGEKAFDGVANSIVGAANATQNANATLIFGAGNAVSNSYGDVNLDIGSINPADPIATSKALGAAVGTSGGQILVIGGANAVDYARFSAITGVSNSLTGKDGNTSDYNFITGAKNTLSNTDSTYVIGSSNTVSDGTSNVVIGDKRKLTGATNDVVIGSADNEMATTVSDATILGHNANATTKDGVALGSNSVASVAAGVAGTVPTGTTVSDTDKESATWTSTLGAVSVGVPGTNAAATQTRQITGVAAGTQATDAVNMAQLNAVNTVVNANKTSISTLETTVNNNKTHFVHINQGTSGTNYDNNGAKGTNSIAIGKASTAGDNSIIIGQGAISKSGDATKYGNGSGDIAIGMGVQVNNYVNQGGGIAIGQNARSENMNGRQEYYLGLGQTTYSGGGWVSIGTPDNPENMVTGIAIGKNSYARSGGTMVGTHNYKGAIGDTTVDTANTINTSNNVLSTTVGANSFNAAALGSIVGTYSIASATDATQNFGATIMGSLNSVESATSDSSYAGVANSIVGLGNVANNTNGTLIFGAGNEVTNSITDISVPMSSSIKSAKDLQTRLKTAIKSSNSGGSTMVMGGGNKADYTQLSSVIGVNNTLIGTSDDISTYNFISGFNNTATNVDNATVIGRNRTVTGADSSIVIGRADSAIETTASDVVSIGRNTNVTVDGGTALGYKSIANVDAGVLGYDQSGKITDVAIAAGSNQAQYENLQTTIAANKQTVSELTTTISSLQEELKQYSRWDNEYFTISDQIEENQEKLAAAEAELSTNQIASDKLVSAWQATGASVSVGDSSTGLSRQITNVAAGTNDTDAVNVAQLKAAKVEVLAGDNTTVTSDNSEGYTKYTVKATDTQVTGLSLANNTLTLSQNGLEDLTVTGIATTTDLANNKVKYFAVNSNVTDNQDNTGAKGTNSVAIGPKAVAQRENGIALGTNVYSGGKGSIVIGSDSKVLENIALEGSIVIGKNATAFTGGGRQEALFGLDPDNWPKHGVGGYDDPTDPTRVATSIVIGTNTYGRTGTIDIGDRVYKGTMGGIEITDNNASSHVNQTTLGTNSYNKGLFSTMVGSYSIATGGFTGSGEGFDEFYAPQNFGATVVGSLNSIRSNGDAMSDMGAMFQGVANTVVGTANITDNTNGSLVFGAGNKITNSLGYITAPTDGASSVDDMVDKLQSAIKGAQGGGSTLAIGGGNTADYTQASSIIGVNNTLTGTSSDVSQYNALTGYNNTATNVDNVTVTGVNNTVSKSTSIVNLGNENAVEDSNNTILLGDNRTVTGSDNSVILGRANKAASTTLRAAADTTLTTAADNVVVMGYNANATVDDGVALGSSSVASVDKGAVGYNPSIEALTDSEKASATWTSTLASVSVGDSANNLTRQITNVAAGTNDTDAVNVAQLKANKVTLTAGDNVTITPTTATDGSTDYKIVSTDTNTYVTEGALSEDGTLTLTRNDKDTVTVKGLATKADVANSTTHYYSVNDRGSTVANYDNTGAKAGMSIAAGPAASAYGSASTVTGAFSRIEGNGENGMSVGFQGATAAAYGSFNVVGAKDGVAFDGVANSIIGVANKTENANAALIMGAGNKITNSYRPVDLTSAGPLAEAMQKAVDSGDTDDMITALSDMVKTSGGAVLAMGGANTADYALLSKVVGVGNTLTGTKGNESKLNMLDGYMNTGTNVNNVTIIGSGNTVTNTNKAVVIGDSRQLTSASNSVILGSADRTMAITVADATAIGHNSNVTVANGVALGSGSVASVDKGVVGYDVVTKEASTETSTAWKSTSAAVSVGDTANNITRQITGVAAGMQETDAVNVAQLKQVAEVAEEAGKTKLKFTGDDKTAEISRGNDEVLNITGGAAASNLTDGNIGVVKDGDTALKVKLAKDLTGLNSVVVGDAVTLGTTGLTITNGPSVTNTGINAGNQKITNVVAGVADTDAVNVSQLNANKIHYFQVNSAANGTNYNNNGASGTDAIAIGKATAMPHNSVVIGNNAQALDSNGGKGSGDIAIGNGARINNYADQSASIALGQNAQIDNMAGQQEALFSLGQTTFSGGLFSSARIPADPSKVATGIAIGENTFVRSGGLMVGTHNYRGALGDVDVDSANTRATGVNINATTLGTNSYNNGAFSTITGAYSIASGNYAGGRNTTDAAKNFGATIMGSLNSVESATASSSYSGIANSIVGTANRTFNSNGSLIFGAGNEITNSVTNINAPTSAGSSAKALQDTLMTSIKSSASGGSTLAIGGGNKADYTLRTAIIGVNNTVTGTSSNISQQNYVTGYNNTGTNVDDVTIIGTNRTVSDASNSVVIGSADSVMTSSASDAVTIGRNANTTINGGVALGSSSVASVDKGAEGYNPSVEALTDAEKASATWTSTLAAVSVGDSANNLTRQITNVAAGTNDTDAVNVAQLKANKVTLTAGDNVTITPTTATDGSTDYKIVSTDTNTYVTEGALSEDGTLTLTRNDKDTVTVKGLATKADVANSTTHYYSVNDRGSTVANYDNTGAKAGMSIAAGPAASAYGSASTVTGAFSRIEGNGENGMSVGFQGATAAAYGSFNVVGAKDGVAFDGVANSIIGVANKTENANAALIMGAGNKITNSYRPVDLTSAGPLAEAMQKAVDSGDTDDMITALSDMVKTSGGAVLAMGGANTADYALLSKVVGVGNTLTGTKGNESKLNMLDGYMNTGTNVNNVTIIGSGNTVTNTNKAVVIGDSRQLTSASNSVILGSADRTMATTVADATAIGHNANVTVDNGVALGSGSVASVDKDVAGYDVLTKAASTETSATWKSTLAAVSVGVPTDGGAATATRQITGVAAGMQDTDAVNVAQLKKVAEAANEAGNTTLKFTGDDTTAEISRTNNQVLNITGGAEEFTDDDNIGVVKDGDNALKVKLAKDLTGLNSVAVGDSVTLGTTGLTITNGPSVIATGIDAGSKVITNVANGVNPTDAVNVSQLNANKVTVAEGTNVTVTPTTANDGSTTYTVASKDTYTTAGTYDKDGKKITFTQNDTDKNYEVDVSGLVDGITEDIDKGLNFAGDSGDAINKKLDQTLDIVGGAKGDLTTGNIGVVSEDGKLNVRLAKDLTGLNSVAVGDAVKLGTTGLTITNGPSVTTTGIDAGSKVITNVANGVNPTDAVNVSQLTANKVTVAEGTNVTVTPTTANDGSTTYTVASKDTYTTAGTYDKDGKKITFTQNDTDKNYEVDVSGLVDGISEDIDKGLNFAGDSGDAINKKLDQTLDIVGGAQGDLTTGNIGVVSDDGKLNVRLAKDLTGLNSVAVGNAVKLGTTGLTITNGPSVTTAGIDAGSKTITNVANGVNPTDAVNVSQLNANKVTVEAGDNVTVTPTTANDGSTTYKVASKDTYVDEVTFAGNTLTVTRNDKKSFEVKNIATIDDISNQVGDVALNFAGDDATDKVTTKNKGTLNITGGAASNNLTDDNIGVVKSGDDTLQVKLSKDLNGLNSVRVGGSKAGEGIYIANQTVTSTKDGVDPEKGNYITGLTNKTWNPTANGYVSGRAATEDQLNSVYETINKNIESSKAVSGKNITVDENNKVNLNDNITLGGDTAANQVNINGNDAKVTAGDGANKVVVDGTNGQVTIGEAGKGIVMGNQTDVVGTKSDNTTDTQSGHFITGLDNTTWDPANKGVVADRAATEGQLKNVADNISKQISDIDTAVKSSSRVFESDSGADAQVTRKNTDPMKLKGGAAADNLSDNNIGVVNNSDKTGFDIKLSKDIKGLNSIEVNNKITIGTGDNQTIIEGDTINTGSVTTGNTTINNEGLTIVNEDSSKNITINNNNVNMGGNVIKNIGEGSEPTDAINKTQFDRAINNLGTGMNQINNRVNKLDNRVNRVGAGAAALAALHPLEFSPDAKWEVTAGVGNYRGANAIALGAFYRPNFDTMFSIGTSYGGGENMINAGVTWRIGEGETKAYPSKTVMAQEIDDLKNVVSEQQDQIEELKKLVNSLINK